jgi:hypothetical protein
MRTASSFGARDADRLLEGQLVEYDLMSNVIVWDIETIPDMKAFAAANCHDGKSDDEIRAELGEKFPKHIYHSIICIGALVAHREEGGVWLRSERRTLENDQRGS